MTILHTPAPVAPLVIHTIDAVVCTYNGATRISKVLECITSPRNISRLGKIIVVDNNSTDDLGKYVTAFTDTNLSPSDSGKILFIKESQQGLMWARIRGLRESTADVVAFLDDDNYCAETFFERIGTEFAANSSIGYLGVATALPDQLRARSFGPASLASYAVGTLQYGHDLIPEKSTVWGAGLCVLRRPILAAMDSGYSPLLVGRSGQIQLAGDDSEICLLLANLGSKGFYLPEVLVIHDVAAGRFTVEKYIAMKKGFALSACTILVLKESIAVRKPFGIFPVEFLISTLKALKLGLYTLTAGQMNAEDLPRRITIFEKAAIAKSYLKGIYRVFLDRNTIKSNMRALLAARHEKHFS